MKTSELMVLSDLSGWRMGEGYFIELEHGLMATFPALISKTGEYFVCLTKADVQSVVSLLPRRPYAASSILLLINEKAKTAFILIDVGGKWKRKEHSGNWESESVPILIKDDVEKMMVGDLKWAPGLIGPGTNKTEFVETIELAAKRNPP